MNLKKFFPRYQSLGENWRARLLGAILSLVIPFTLVLLVVLFLARPGFTIDIVVLIIGLLFEMSIFLVWRYIGLNPASIYLVFGSSILTSLCIYYSGGIASVILGAQAVVVVIAALLTTPRVTVLFVAAMLLFNFSLVYFDQSQQLTDVVLNDTPIIRFAFQTALLLITAGIVLYSTRILWALTQNLATSEYRFRALFERTSDAVFLTGLDLRLVEANDQAARLLEYKPEEMVGLPVKKLFPIDEWADVQRRFDTVKGNENLVAVTRRFLTKGGDELMLETNLSLVHDAAGKPLHYQSTGRDVTQKVKDEQRLKSTLVHLTVKASTDSLTGVLNRETIMQHAQAEWERYLRNHEPLSLMLVDMDELKLINDTHGHLVGDQALNIVARLIDRYKRPYDWLGRFGGDEFMVVLPGASEKDAQMIARRMEGAIDRERLKAGKKQVKVSCAFGVASTDGNESTIRSMIQLLEKADLALYKAKRGKGKS